MAVSYFGGSNRQQYVEANLIRLVEEGKLKKEIADYITELFRTSELHSPERDFAEQVYENHTTYFKSKRK